MNADCLLHVVRGIAGGCFGPYNRLADDFALCFSAGEAKKVQA